jgi:uncharacterized protein YbjQ (UPF0145 family)
MQRVKVIRLVFVFFMLVLMLILTGCSTSITRPDTGAIYDVALPAKNFEAVGLVFAETQIANRWGTLESAVQGGAQGGSQGATQNVQASRHASQMTYNALLREAHRLGAHDIVNVRIDKRVEGREFLFWTKKTRITYFGSALAIRYVAGHPAADTPISPRSRPLPSRF